MVRFRSGLIRAMTQKGYEVHLLIPAEASLMGDYGEQKQSLQALGATLHEYPLQRARISPAQDMRAFCHMVHIIRAIQADIVMAYMMKPVVYGIMAAKLCGVKQRFAMLDGLGFAFTQRGENALSMSARITRLLLRMSLKFAHHVLFLNRDDGQTLRNTGVLNRRTPSTIIHGTGLDLEHFNGPDTNVDCRTFLMISRLLRDKGVREFVEAARIVCESHPAARFVLVGDYDAAPGAITIEEVKSWHWIDYVGPQSDVRPWITDCLAFALPSYREGRPRTVMEAMAMRRACIVTDVPGCRDCIINGETGWLVPPQDPGALAHAMISYLDNPKMAATHGATARVTAETFYPEDRVNQSVLQALGL